MKKLNLFLILYFVFLTHGWAQPPNAFNYSALARNSIGQPIINTTIGIQISILKNSTTGVLKYSENHFVNTDSYGQFNLIIGTGAIQNGSMDSIDWGNDNFYLKIGMDINGGTNFLTMGMTQLLSVPYALYAKNSGNSNGITINSISSSNDTLYLSNGQTFTITNINSGGYTEIEVFVSSTQILNISNIPIILIPAPGLNSYLDIDKVIVEYKYNNIPYDNYSSIALAISNGIDEAILCDINGTFLNDTLSKILYNWNNSQNFGQSDSAPINAPLMLYGHNFPITGNGNGTIKVIIRYKIRTLH